MTSAHVPRRMVLQAMGPLGVLQVSAFPGAKAIYRDFWSGAYREA
jgi:hypothetical protein